MMEKSGDVLACHQHCVEECDKHKHLIGHYVTALHIHSDDATRWFLYDLGVGQQPTDTSMDHATEPNTGFDTGLQPRRRRLSLVSLTLLELPLGKRDDWSKTWGSDKGGATASIILANTVYVLISMFDVKFEAASQNVARFSGYFLGREFSLLDGGAELLMGFGTSTHVVLCLCFISMRAQMSRALPSLVSPMGTSLVLFRHDAAYKAPIPADLLNKVSVIGDVVAGVTNLISRVKLIADQAMKRVNTFIAKVDPYVDKMSAVMTSVKQFGDCSRDLTALADIEEPIYAEHLPVITSPSTQRLVNRLELAMDTALSVLGDGEKKAELGSAVTDMETLDNTVRGPAVPCVGCDACFVVACGGCL